MSVYKRGQFWALQSNFEATAGFTLVELVGSDTSRGSRGQNSVTPLVLQSNHTVPFTWKIDLKQQRKS